MAPLRCVSVRFETFLHNILPISVVMVLPLVAEYTAELFNKALRTRKEDHPAMIDAQWQNWLQDFLVSQGGVAGTIHRHIESSQKTGLELVAAVNIPPKVQEIVDWVPPGKGMAGQALVQGVPIQTCNLKDDSSGAVRPGAKAVEAQAAVALPVKADSGRIEAIVGIAYNHERSFAAEDLSRLEQAASTLLEAR